MITTGKPQETFTKRFNVLRDRYRRHVLVTLTVLSTLAFIFALFFTAVWDWVFKSGLIQYVTFLMVLDVAESLNSNRGPWATHTSRNQDESMPRLIEAARLCRAEGVDLLEYAAVTTLPLIRAVHREGVPIRLLIKHPDTVFGLQRDRIIATLDTIFNSIFVGYKGQFEVRCYRLPFNLRARRLGKEVLELGWLTTDIKGQTAYGHGNPSLIVDLSARSNDFLLEFFNRTFDDLWNAADTEDARLVLGRLQPKM
jgi:hypothetical protein